MWKSVGVEMEERCGREWELRWKRGVEESGSWGGIGVEESGSSGGREVWKRVGLGGGSEEFCMKKEGSDVSSRPHPSFFCSANCRRQQSHCVDSVHDTKLWWAGSLYI